ncbi:hypothetical protein H6P81_005625 [Aristolochia fimbriata]|uniref:Uncharacterized protein n=1 Tax=Aristolochia fimbriata TaxID=158543 RepID=A0AAV7EW30_ARIFI|nr:hypothetical protein H6P81_005625 [Aristolochia fimbriata]
MIKRKRKGSGQDTGLGAGDFGSCEDQGRIREIREFSRGAAGGRRQPGRAPFSGSYLILPSPPGFLRGGSRVGNSDVARESHREAHTCTTRIATCSSPADVLSFFSSPTNRRKRANRGGTTACALCLPYDAICSSMSVDRSITLFSLLNTLFIDFLPKWINQRRPSQLPLLLSLLPAFPTEAPPFPDPIPPPGPRELPVPVFSVGCFQPLASLKRSS